MKRLMVVAALTLAGCANSALQSELPKYAGRPIGDLIARLGMPSAEQSIMGQKVYVWSTSQSFAYAAPSATYGTVGNRPVYATTVTPASVDGACTLRIFVNASGVITNGDWNGANGPCLSFADRLK